MGLPLGPILSHFDMANWENIIFNNFAKAMINVRYSNNIFILTKNLNEIIKKNYENSILYVTMT